MTKVINLFGTAGAGKSTLAAELFAAMKKSSYNCELVVEAAKDEVWEQNHLALACQPFIFGKQLKRLWRLVGQVDYIVTDSPLLLSAVYCDTHRWGNAFRDSVIEIFQKFDNINFLLPLDKSKYCKIGRVHTIDEVEEIHKNIQNLLDNLGGIPYTSLLQNGTGYLSQVWDGIFENK